MGRLPHGACSATGKRIVDEAIGETVGAACAPPVGAARRPAPVLRWLGVGAVSRIWLLLDEPTNHLDPPASALLSLVKNKDIAVIAVFARPPVAEAFADRILVLNESRPGGLWYTRRCCKLR
ncbi:hypothetical protein M8494_19100 [Serratia ureilytica]